MSSGDRVSIPLFAELIPDGVRAGTEFIVEFDPSSQWIAVATTITAKYLQAGGRVAYVTTTRSREAAKEGLSNLGVNVSVAIKEGRLTIDDWYTATLTGGRIDTEPGKAYLAEPVEGGLRMRSLKVADLSVEWLKASKDGWQSQDVAETWAPGALGIFESNTEILRFNEENPFVEFYLSRVLPNERRARRIGFAGLATGIHSQTLYKRLENAVDGIVEVTVMERDGEAQDFLRVRSLKGQPRDARWHRIEIKPNGEATLVG